MPTSEELFIENQELYNAKSNHKATRIPIIDGFYTYLFYIYMGLITGLIYYLYYKLTMNNYIKFAIVISFIAYPFLIYPIEEFIYSIFVVIVAFIRGEPTSGKHSPV
jgi:hypothetical protein